MVNNTTLISLVNKEIVSDDSMSAIIFIIFVLLWYSSSMIFLIGMQIGRSNERLDHATEDSSKLFVQNFREQNNNKEILSKIKIFSFLEN